MKRIRIFSAVALSLAGTARADFTPIPLNPASFNHDVVVEAVAPKSLSDAVTATLDQGTNKGGATLYERSYNAAAPTTGMPVAGSLVTNAALNHIFRMPSDYHVNNVVMVGHQNGGRSPVITSGTLTLTAPAPFNKLSFLNSAGNGPVLVGYVIRYADSTTESNVFTALDWFNAAANVFNAAGRVSLAGGVQNVGGNPAGALFATDVVLANPAVNVTSVDFYYVGSGTSPNLNNTNSNGRAVILAISGSTDSVNYNPLDVTGYNQDVVVEADGPQTTGTGVASAGALTNNITATMDGGLSKANNTWYEQGYYAAFPESGIPAAGASVTSVWYSARYTMPGSYVGNCATVVYSNGTSANLNFAAPITVGALSFLCAAANGDTFVPCVVRFADGTTETNTIFVPDWFNRELPWAYFTHGRVLPSNRTLNQTPDQFYDPFAAPFPFAGDFRFGLPAARLFDAVINVTNTASSVTNVSLSFTNGAASTRVVSIFAVSGAAPGNVPPIFGNRGTPTPGMPNNAPINAVSQLKQWAGTNNAVLSVTNLAGTGPLSYQWMKAPRGGGLRDKLYTFDYSTFADVVDGGRISGANTSALVISNALPSDSADYLVVMTNPYGAATSTVATLMILTTNVSVLVGAAAGDTIASYTGEGAGSGESVDHVIDRVAQKWLSFGLQQGGVNSGLLPFVGPVGYRVTPLAGASIVTALRFFTANDNQGRDPVDYTLEGSNDGATWSPITGGKLLGTLSLPTGRNGTGATPINPLNQNLVEVNFANSTAYKSFRVSITNVADYRAIPLMQISEIDMLGTFLSGIFNVTGGGSACIGEAGVPVGLSGSQINVTYFLLRDSVFSGVLIEGTGVAISFGNQTNSGTYSVLASNMTTAIVGPMNGNALVTILVPPAITSGPSPAEFTNYVGASASFVVTTPNSQFTYQWRRDGTNLANGGNLTGATSTNLRISPLTAADGVGGGHGYSCVVSGSCGVPVASPEATLIVLPLPNLVGAWTNRYAGAANLNDVATALAFDANGNVLITGYSENAASFNTDFYVAKYAAADGALLWEKRGKAPDTSHESRPSGLIVDQDGNAVVTGSGGVIGYVAKYAATDGTLIWQDTPLAAGTSSSPGKALAMDTNGNVLVAASARYFATSTSDIVVRKYAGTNGTLLWERPIGLTGGSAEAAAVAVDGNGDVVVTGYGSTSTLGDQCVTAKISGTSGALLWSRTQNGPAASNDRLNALALDANGNAIVTGLSDYNYYTAKYASADGMLIWEKTYSAAGFNLDQGMSVVVDASDNVFVTGSSWTTTTQDDWYTAKYAAADGALLWEARYSSPGSGSDQAAAVKLDARGNVVVAGTTWGAGFDYNLIMYGAADGAVLWSAKYNGPADWHEITSKFCLGVNPAGEIALTGGSDGDPGPSTVYDFLTLKFSPFVAGNNNPTLAIPLSDTNGVYGTPFNFTFAATAFTDPDAGQTLSYEATGLPAGITFTPATRSFSGTPTNVGTISVTVTATDDGSPALSTNDVFDIVIAKAPLTATADNKSRGYGESNPALAFSYSGFVLGESEAVLDTPPVPGTTAAPGSPAGLYPITLSGGADDHYEFSYVGGTLSVTPAPLTVVADNTNRTYGTLNPAFTGGLSGLMNGDNITSAFSSAADTNSPPGAYPITTALADPDSKLGNYSVTTNDGTLTVTAAPLTVTANDTNRVYGVANPDFTGSIIGLVNTDNIAATFVTAATITDPPGTYPITPLLSDPDGKLGNYSVTANNGTLTIVSPPELSISSGGGSITLSWPASYAGFVLEFAVGLTPPIDWQPVTSGITENGGIKSYTVAPDPNVEGRLYRLRLP